MVLWSVRVVLVGKEPNIYDILDEGSSLHWKSKDDGLSLYWKGKWVPDT